MIYKWTPIDLQQELLSTPPDPNTFLFMDNSHYAWGAHLEPMRLSFHGHRTEAQSQLHINMLEMMAIRLALKQAITFIHHSCVMISTDNTTVVSYINKPGRTHSPDLCVEVWEILSFCQEHDIVIRIHHIPDKINILAECKIGQTYQNRMGTGSISSEIRFPDAQISHCGFVCNSFQSQTPIVCVPVPNSHVLAVDALSMNWNYLHMHFLLQFWYLLF